MNKSLEISELSKKNIDQNSLIFIFIKVADSSFADNNASQQSIIRGLNNYLKKANFQLSVKQQQQITFATQIVLSDSSMQAQILNLLQSDN